MLASCVILTCTNRSMTVQYIAGSGRSVVFSSWYRSYRLVLNELRIHALVFLLNERWNLNMLVMNFWRAAGIGSRVSLVLFSLWGLARLDKESCHHHVTLTSVLCDWCGPSCTPSHREPWFYFSWWLGLHIQYYGLHLWSFPRSPWTIYTWRWQLSAVSLTWCHVWPDPIGTWSFVRMAKRTWR